MPNFIKSYVRAIEKVNWLIGRATMYMIFGMMGVLFYSAITKTFFLPAHWTLEFAQFMMVAYFLLGGPYSLQLNGHVRMDLLHSRWSPRTRSRWDAFTSIFLVCYLVLLLYGSVSSTVYAFQFGERSFSLWRPYMWPVKVVMTFGIFMMLLQATAQFFKDLAAARGEPLEESPS